MTPPALTSEQLRGIAADPTRVAAADVLRLVAEVAELRTAYLGAALGPRDPSHPAIELIGARCAYKLPRHQLLVGALEQDDPDAPQQRATIHAEAVRYTWEPGGEGHVFIGAAGHAVDQWGRKSPDPVSVRVADAPEWVNAQLSRFSARVQQP